jgi:hypothetical protein
MPVNYRVSGDVDITPAIGPGRHDWSMLERGIIRDENAKLRKAAEEQAAQAAKAKQAAEEAKYAPEFVNDLAYNDIIQKKGQKVLRYSADAYKKGTIGTPEYNFNIGQQKNEVALDSGKAKAAIETAKMAYQNTDQLPKYVDKNKLNTKIYDAAHPKQKDTASLRLFNQPFNDLPPEKQREVLGKMPKDVDPDEVDMGAIDPKLITEIPSNYYDAINTVDMYKDKTNGLPEQIKQGQFKFTNYNPNDGTADGLMIQTDGLKATFMKPVLDNKGNVIKDRSGNPRWVPGVTDQVADMFIQNDPEIRGEAEYQWENYLEKETIARSQAGDSRDPRIIRQELEKDADKSKFIRQHVKNGLEMFNKSSPINEIKQVAAYTSPKGGDSEDFSATKVTNQERNYNIKDPKNPNGPAEVVKGTIEEEYRFSGKKIDTPLIINSAKIIDEETNTDLKGLESVGGKKILPTRVMLVPVSNKTGQTLPNVDGKLKNNPNVSWEWMLEGSMETTKKVDGKEEKTNKNVLIPYDQVSNDLKAKFGFDLDERDASEISNIELMSRLKKRNPTATPEQLVQMFKNFRAQ